MAVAVVLRRELGDGAVAGTVVGVIIFLLVICLYPIIVGQIRRRRRRRLDAETGGPQALDLGHGPRLSSTDSCKNEVELSRATQKWDSSSALRDHDGFVASPVPSYGHQSVSVSDGRYHRPGPVQGMSADYYNAPISSEAASSHIDVDTSHARPSAFLGNTVKDRVRRFLRQGSERSADSCYAPSGRQLALSSGPAKPPHTATWKAMGTLQSSTPPMDIPQPYAEQTSKSASPSPPAYPAPGTVNPMDIMPASTESEVWHRTEQELLGFSHGRAAFGSSPVQHGDGFGSHDVEMVSPLDHTANDQHLDEPGNGDPGPVSPLEPGGGFDNVHTGIVSPPSPAAPSEPPAVVLVQAEASVCAQHAEQNRPQTGDTAWAHLQSRTYMSNPSTPDRGPASVDPSPPNIPLPQDSLGEDSLTSSDYRSSNSPKSPSTASRAAYRSDEFDPYRCNEPGCDQAFDHLHKLKHHQRYHSKSHKCTFAGCDRAFGTKTHLDRHINERHDKKRKFYCPIPDCLYHKTGGKGFSRRDNWRRHMVAKHATSAGYAPIIVDTE
ncbi:hypothetical protein XA68_11992 [Ophiocordyceps unilateralis]|uniref:C2H2-type domain-containing protein n=1 Tax=Ophiocordyceps unilateralis TaxID=268505 RepID=A0A2A9PN23_OPHUN|nr:hypothetical protein XA68_11992 [Ophiocordyceps unilateralis]